MDYEQKCKEYLERAKEQLNGAKVFDYDNEQIAHDIRTTVYSIFPELVESEDERIRKVLIGWINLEPSTSFNDTFDGFSKEQILAWLEKQSNTDEIINRDEFAQGVLRGAAINLITWIDYNLAEGNMCLSNMECKDIEDALVHADWNKIYAYLKKKLEKQGEQKPADKVEPKFKVGDTMRTLQEAADGYTDGMPVVISVDKEYYHCTNELIAIKDQDDYEYPPMNRIQTPADKVEPKFHEGEWLCENEPNNYARFIQILETVNVQGKERYRISRDIHNNEDVVEFDFVEKYYHKFDIKDAKDGDILYSIDSKQPFIYRGKNIHEQATAYCGINKYGNFFVWNTKDCIITLDKYIPATREQRDTLMKAMADAGYTFDFEKKELKKIEQNPAWSEEDEYNFAFIQEALLGLDGDDSYREKCCKMADWLESLKDKYTWKPSEEQIIALRWVLNNIPYNKHKEEISGLLEQIKDL